VNKTRLTWPILEELTLSLVPYKSIETNLECKGHCQTSPEMTTTKLALETVVVLMLSSEPCGSIQIMLESKSGTPQLFHFDP
jgi:hypothetical protein